MEHDEIMKRFGRSSTGSSSKKRAQTFNTPVVPQKKPRNSTKNENELAVTENLVKGTRVLCGLTNVLEEAAAAIESGNKRTSTRLLQVAMDGSKALTQKHGEICEKK